MDIQQNNVAVLHFNLVNQDGSTIFIRKTKLATFNLINPSEVSVPITDIGFDATLNQCWVRIPKASNAATGQYYGVLNIADDDWGTYTTSKIKVYSVVSDSDADTKSVVFTATCIATHVTNPSGGNSPYYNTATSTWWQYSDTLKAFEDTGVVCISGIELDKINTLINTNNYSLVNLVTKYSDIFDYSGSNLFDNIDYVEGYYGEDGITYQASETYWCSGFIPVAPGKFYKRLNGDNSYYVYAYDSDKIPVQVDGTKVYWKSAFESIYIPSAVKYIRVIFPPASINTFMLTDISSLLILNIDRIPRLIAMENRVRSMLITTDNLFNNTDYVEGFYGIDGITYQASGTYWCSGFIPVTPGKFYKRLNGDNSYYVYAYDSDKIPVQVDGTKVYWPSAFESIYIPSAVKYIRVIFPPASINTFMLTLTSVDTSIYIPHLEFNPIYMSRSSTNVQSKSQQGIEELGVVDNQLFNTDYSHLIFYGQSLSMGWEAHEAISITPVPGTYMIGDRVWINQGNDGSIALNPLIASMGTSCGESPAVASAHVMRLLIDKMLPQNTVDIISTNCGEGGKSIERLSKESANGTNYYTTLFQTAISRAKTIADNNSKTISCPAIVWMQGEYNYVNLTGEGLTTGTDATNDKDTYKSLLLTLKNNMQSDIMSTYGQTKKPLFLMYQVAGSYINLEDMPINMAMIEFAEENDDVILMNPTYNVPDYSGGHLSSNGYRWYGEYIAKQMYRSLLKHQSSVTVQAKEFELLDSNTKILIHCQVPKAPLKLDIKTTQSVSSYGFKVKDDVGEITISSVQIIGGTSILLTLSRAISTNAYVAYGGYGRNGTGNVRDSDIWSPKYVYADETTFVAPNHTPIDENNVNYYGRKYPMWNWLIAFYHKLN